MKRKLNKKNILIAAGILVFLILLIVLLLVFTKGKKSNKPKTEAKIVKEEKPKEKVDIINTESKTRPIAISINNTPVAVKVQEGLNKAYLVYEIATEGATSRLLAFYKDVDEDLKIGTVRSARHDFIAVALESDAIFVAYGWSSHAQLELQQMHEIDYINGMVHSKPYWRSNPEGLASEHTAYTSLGKIRDFAYNDMKYNKESSKASNTVLLNYSTGDVDLSKREGVMDANNVTVPYGSVTTKFEYNPDTKMYTKIVNGTKITDHETKEEITTKNIIVERVNYSLCDDKYYWDLDLSSGEGYYITNGKAVPIKWNKPGKKEKTKYTYLDGKEIDVSDGRTYIEIQVTDKKTTIE